jgi:hypothetical protein
MHATGERDGMKPGDRIEITMYSGEILDAIVSAVTPMVL